MLRDMGQLVLAIRGRGDEAELASHGALSAYLLGIWGLPHAILEPVAFHERPELVQHDVLEVVDVVHIADRVAAEVQPSPFQPSPEPLNLERLEALGVGRDRIDQLRVDARALLVQTRELLKS
jgi:HD-like signal output (HDOD) protein